MVIQVLNSKLEITLRVSVTSTTIIKIYKFIIWISRSSDISMTLHPPKIFLHEEMSKINAELLLDKCYKKCTSWNINSEIRMRCTNYVNLIKCTYNNQAKKSLTKIRADDRKLAIGGGGAIRPLPRVEGVEELHGDPTVRPRPKVWTRG